MKTDISGTRQNGDAACIYDGTNYFFFVGEDVGLAKEIATAASVDVATKVSTPALATVVSSLPLATPFLLLNLEGDPSGTC
mmetsp:Transcript_27329/g.62724  ORF Transcript_27329/g.62724 Transcript_27329/m.62724 type:complete len:81 (-) Transcript_27329:536-778(-)